MVGGGKSRASNTYKEIIAKAKAKASEAWPASGKGAPEKKCGGDVALPAQAADQAAAVATAITIDADQAAAVATAIAIDANAPSTE